MIEIIPDNFNRSTFNQVAGHPLQAWEWGEARRKMGIEVVRIGGFGGEKLENVFQMTFHKLPHTPFAIGYLPRSAIPSKAVLEFLEEEGKKRNAIFIKIEPYVINKDPAVIPRSEATRNLISQRSLAIARDDRLVESSHSLFPKWTQIVDLTKSEEALLAGMKQKTRYNIRLAQKHGVQVREMSNAEGFEIFSQLYFDTTKRQSYRGHNKEYHRIIFETLKEKIAHLFIVFYKDTPLSVFEIFTFNDVAYYPYGGSSTEFRNVMAPNLLMWEVIRFAKSAGCKKFDMWGSLPPNYDQSGDWAGFTRFKEGFGTEFVEFVGSYDLVLNSWLYSIYNLADKIRKRLL